MLIWLLAILLLALFAVLGYFKGAVRMLFPLIGLFLGIWLAVPLSPLVRPLVPKMGLEHPLWGYFLPPVIVFFVIALAFIVVGFFGHAKVDLFFKYRSDDVHRTGWQRLNQRLGVCMGLLAGAIYTVLIGVAVHVLGYFTVQVTADSEPSAVTYLNRARADLSASGLDKVAAVFDPAPDYYYQAADILGLLYHNPPLHTRLAAYPPFIALSESPDFEEFAADTDFLTLLASQPTFQELLSNARIQTLLSNQALLDQLGTIELDDLNGFLRTGVSQAHQDPPILGRWEVDPYLTFLVEKRQKADMTAADVRLLRYKMEYIKGFRLYVMPDHAVRLKGPDINQRIGRLEEIEKAVRGGVRRATGSVFIVPETATVPAAGGGGAGDGRGVPGGGRGVTTPTGMARAVANPGQAEQDRVYADRYGMTPGAAPTQPGGGQPTMVLAQPAAEQLAPPPTADELAAEIAQLPVTILADGSWQDQDGALSIAFRPKTEIPQFMVTQKATALASVREAQYGSVRVEHLYLREKGQVMVWSRF